MSLLNIESYVFINVIYLVLFCIQVCVDDVTKKNKKTPKKTGAFPVNIAKFLRTPIFKDVCE